MFQLPHNADLRIRTLSINYSQSQHDNCSEDGKSTGKFNTLIEGEIDTDKNRNTNNEIK